MKNSVTQAINSLTTGYEYDPVSEVFKCMFCNQNFHQDLIYSFEGQLYSGKGAVKQHIADKHHLPFNALLEQGAKSFGLTDIQLTILNAFHKGLTDEQIAQQHDITPATVRNYRFKFNEKKRQSINFLALMNCLEHTQLEGKQMGIQSFDERFNISEKDRKQTMENFVSQETKRIIQMPRKEKAKIILLQYLMSHLADTFYSEKEINKFLKKYVEDFVSVRRYLVEYGFLGRTNDGSRYWKI